MKETVWFKKYIICINRIVGLYPMMTCEKRIKEDTFLKFSKHIWYFGETGRGKQLKLDNVINSVAPTPSMSGLTHCGLMTPYGDMELGQYWPR